MLAHVERMAPDFDLEGVQDDQPFKRYKLSDYKDKWLVMFFYPLDFTFICPTEIQGFAEKASDFRALNAEVVGISTDSVHSHKAWLKDLGKLGYPLLADMNHSVSRDYGTLIEEEGVALRGTFIIDPDHKLRYAVYHDRNVGRSVDEALRVLTALQTGELCPVGWHKGEKTLGKA